MMLLSFSEQSIGDFNMVSGTSKSDDSLHISQEDFEVPETMLKSPIDCSEKENNIIQLEQETNEDSWGLNDDNW